MTNRWFLGGAVVLLVLTGTIVGQLVAAPVKPAQAAQGPTLPDKLPEPPAAPTIYRAAIFLSDPRDEIFACKEFSSPHVNIVGSWLADVGKETPPITSTRLRKETCREAFPTKQVIGSCTTEGPSGKSTNYVYYWEALDDDGIEINCLKHQGIWTSLEGTPAQEIYLRARKRAKLERRLEELRNSL